VRAPTRRRDLRRTICTPPGETSLSTLAQSARYVGSAEHKSYPSFAGPPKLRADASKCDPNLTSADAITSWLRAGIELGQVGAPWEGAFPRYVWYEVGELLYEARLVNRGAGAYKGYPLEASERPEGL
jgi:hypothetical protein